jgi:hypothetical protein
MRKVLERYGHLFYFEQWTSTKVLILNNVSVFHGKGIGVSEYLKRLFLTYY